jgi:predicted phosphoribosyltransferase
LFTDRREAGVKLAERLMEYKDRSVVVLAIPRGGVVVAFEVSRRLGVPLDLIIPRKLGAPFNPELAIGAVTQDGTIVLNENIVEELQVPKNFIEFQAKEQIREIDRRMKSYRGDRAFPDLRGKTVILIDDGIATGATVRAAVQSIRKSEPGCVVIAVPVAPPQTVKSLAGEADMVIALETPAWFAAIGQFYENFNQTSDEEVIDLMSKANA